jgi:hypothetical protein
MSSLADALKEAQIQADPFETWIDDLDEDDRVALIEAAGNPKLSTKRMAVIIREYGGKVGDARLNEWRTANGFTRA